MPPKSRATARPSAPASNEPLHEDVDQQAEVEDLPERAFVSRADYDALIAQLTEQGALLEQLQQRLNSETLDESEPSTSDSQSRIVTPPPGQFTPAALPDPRPPIIPEFSGKVSEFANFMASCTLVFAMCPNTYTTDERKVLFIVAHLRGTPMNWAREIADNDTHPLRNDYQAFRLALSGLYSDRNLRMANENKLELLHQTKSAAAYAAEFQSLTNSLGFNDQAECFLFYRGLKKTIKDALTTVGRASPLSALISQAIAIDQRQFHRAMEEKQSSNSNSNSNSQSSSRPQNSSSNNSNRAPQNNSNGFRTSKGPRGPLPEEEKQRRKDNNLCLYCADPSHTTVDCPKAPKRLSPPGIVSNVQISRYPVPPTMSFQLPETSTSENYSPQTSVRSEV